MGARAATQNVRHRKVLPKLPVTDFPVGAGAGREDREAATSPLCRVSCMPPEMGARAAPNAARRGTAAGSTAIHIPGGTQG